MRRIERAGSPLRQPSLERRRRIFAPVDDPQSPELALRYSNGYVTVEISYDALDAYINANGDVPLPLVEDRETGDWRAFDARNNVRVVADSSSVIREVSTRSRDGLHVRVNFIDD
jgi:hypothetical protein